jgi:hypothetical protein
VNRRPEFHGSTKMSCSRYVPAVGAICAYTAFSAGRKINNLTYVFSIPLYVPTPPASTISGQGNGVPSEFLPHLAERVERPPCWQESRGPATVAGTNRGAPAPTHYCYKLGLADRSLLHRLDPLLQDFPQVILSGTSVASERPLVRMRRWLAHRQLGRHPIRGVASSSP